MKNLSQKYPFKKEEFMAIVGFYGNTALVDKRILSASKALSIEQMLEKSMLAQAVRAVIYEDIVLENPSIHAKKEIICSFFKIKDFSSIIHELGIHTHILTTKDSYSKKIF